MANIGKQLERAITDNLKERGYSHYSYENYIIIGNNLVAAVLIYSTIKKQLIVDIRYKKIQYDKLYFEFMNGSNYTIKKSDIFAPNSVPLIYGKTLILPVNSLNTETVMQNAVSLAETIDSEVKEFGNIDVNSVVLGSEKAFRLKALALLDMGQIEELLRYCETRVKQYADSPESDFGIDLYLRILAKYGFEVQGKDEKEQISSTDLYWLDDIQWQIESVTNWFCEKHAINMENLNADDERQIELLAANIPGAFVAWLATTGRIGSFHIENDEEAVKDLINHRISGSEFIVDYCDGKLTKEDICDKDNSDLCTYYVGTYLDDYFDFLRLNKMEVMDIVFDGPIIDKFVAFIEERYKEWENKR